MTTLPEPPYNTMFPPHDSDEFAQSVFTSGPMDLSITAEAFPSFEQQTGQEVFSAPLSFDATFFQDTTSPSYVLNSRASPSMYDESDMRLSSSSLSTASAPSATSSAIGSPQSNHGQMGAGPEWASAAHGLGVGIVSSDHMFGSDFPAVGIEEFPGFDFGVPAAKGFVDPSLIHPEALGAPMGIPPFDVHFPQNHYPTSPSVASSSPQPNVLRTNSSSPYLHHGSFPQGFPSSPFGAPIDPHARAPSVGNFVPPTPGESHSGDEKEKQRCTWPDCGKVFKDLKAHMLTHQNERPEKCPIQTCDYHTKGFARKYDKNRHTLTHYKGTMVCGFCPGSGSAAEKSFNRADVFKRHLTAVHGVEQCPPNSRKKSSAGIKRAPTYAADATGKCSTCSQTFTSVQDFYEHLDECVLRIVQQEDPAEAINAKHMAEVENDKEVHETLEKNNLPITTETTSTSEEDVEADTDEEDGDSSSKSSHSPTHKKKGNPVNGVQKSRGLTHSRVGVQVPMKRSRKHRRDYPSSWGFNKGQMTMKKRVMAVFEGPRRLAKDDMMLCTDHEVRIKLSDGKSYITDLDVQTLKRAEGFLGATPSERGPWISDDPNAEQLKEMQEVQMMLDTNAVAAA